MVKQMADGFLSRRLSARLSPIRDDYRKWEEILDSGGAEGWGNSGKLFRQLNTFSSWKPPLALVRQHLLVLDLTITQ